MFLLAYLALGACAGLLAGLLGPGELPMDASDDPLFYDELEMSALQEAGNVTISAFLNELGMHLHEPRPDRRAVREAHHRDLLLPELLPDVLRHDRRVLRELLGRECRPEPRRVAGIPFRPHPFHEVPTPGLHCRSAAPASWPQRWIGTSTPRKQWLVHSGQ